MSLYKSRRNLSTVNFEKLRSELKSILPNTDGFTTEGSDVLNVVSDRPLTANEQAAINAAVISHNPADTPDQTDQKTRGSTRQSALDELKGVKSTQILAQQQVDIAEVNTDLQAIVDENAAITADLNKANAIILLNVGAIGPLRDLIVGILNRSTANNARLARALNRQKRTITTQNIVIKINSSE